MNATMTRPDFGPIESQQHQCRDRLRYIEEVATAKADGERLAKLAKIADISLDHFRNLIDNRPQP